MSLAIFDLDDTLLDNDTDRLWSNYLLKNQYVDTIFLDTSENFYRAYLDGNFDIHAYVAHLIRPILKLSKEAQHALQADFFQTLFKAQLRTSAVAQLKLHLAKNDHCLIITAANEFLVSGLKETLEVEAVLATQLETNVQGCVLNKIKGEPCFETGKITHLKAYLDKINHSEIGAFGEIYVYTDSLHDLPLLQLATHPFLINPKPTASVQQAIQDYKLQVMTF